MKPVVLLMGPTGAGKSDLALRLAERLPVEIISVDSAMVYRGMDIGTGKPPESLLRRFPHHLVDIVDPSEPYSAGQFMRDAQRAIADIHARGKLPLLVGGTMLYFRALRGGLAQLPAADPTIREQLTARAREVGWPSLHAQLAAVDPQAAARIQRNDAQRIQRALEVFMLTGETLSAKQRAAPAGPNLLWSAYAWQPSDRQQLYKACCKRGCWTRSAGCMRAPTCTWSCPPSARWATARSGNIWMARSVMIRRWPMRCWQPGIWHGVN